MAFYNLIATCDSSHGLHYSKENIFMKLWLYHACTFWWCSLSIIDLLPQMLGSHNKHHIRLLFLKGNNEIWKLTNMVNDFFISVSARLPIIGFISLSASLFLEENEKSYRLTEIFSKVCHNATLHICQVFIKTNSNSAQLFTLLYLKLHWNSSSHFQC